jgi:hypothetical protein
LGFLLFLLALILPSSGCTLKRIAVLSTAEIVEDAFAAFNEEEDLVIAESAAASNLKLLEGLLKSEPNHRGLLLLAARGFGGYAFAFVEEKTPGRARRLYIRGRNYGLSESLGRGSGRRFFGRRTIGPTGSTSTRPRPGPWPICRARWP